MSTLRLTTISNQTGSSSVPSETVINGSAKAWVNFNGTGTVAIRASFNVSSITDLGTGQYRVNFTTSMPDVNFCTLGFGMPQNDAAERTKWGASAVSYVEIYNATMNNTYYDSSQMFAAVFR